MFVKHEGESSTGYKTALQFELFLINVYFS